MGGLVAIKIKRTAANSETARNGIMPFNGVLPQGSISAVT